MTMEILNIDERNELERCEVVIKQGFDTFVEVGQALLTIRDKRLYRASFRTFEEYCNDRWSIGKAYSHRMIAAAEVIKNLSPRGDILPQTEYHARPLAAIEPELQPIAWQQAIEATNGKPTNKAVQEAVNELKLVNEEIKQAKVEPLFVANTIEEIVKKAREIKQQEAELKKAERLEAIEQIKQKIENENLSQPNKKYHVIAIDPPWAYEERGGFTANSHDVYSNRGGVDYPTMSLSQISQIQLPAADDCVLFLWTTHAFLRDSFELLDKWNFTYKATLVWDKQKMGIGRTVRMQVEFCLLATKGSPIINGSAERDIIHEARREHSRKPEAFYQMVERMCVGNKLDYFSRENRQNWDTYGAEKGKF